MNLVCLRGNKSFVYLTNDKSYENAFLEEYDCGWSATSGLTPHQDLGTDGGIWVWASPPLMLLRCVVQYIWTNSVQCLCLGVQMMSLHQRTYLLPYRRGTLFRPGHRGEVHLCTATPSMWSLPGGQLTLCGPWYRHDCSCLLG